MASEQDKLIAAATRFLPYRCDFCRQTYMRPEGQTTCPGCRIGPMRLIEGEVG